MVRIVLWAAGAAGLVYFGDWALAAIHPRYETVHVDRLIAVHEKFNKIGYEPTDSRDERCVGTLFSHAGSRPCWYVKRHRTEVIDIGE